MTRAQNCGEDVLLLGGFLSGSEEDVESVCSLPGARELPWEDASNTGLVIRESGGGSRLAVHYHYRAVGRRLKSTKLRHSWTLRPACCDFDLATSTVDDVVARVDLKHSRLSGKKQIFLDGTCVFTSWQACLSWSFDNDAHGVRTFLVSEKGRHAVRCEDIIDKDCSAVDASPSPRSSHSADSCSELPLPIFGDSMSLVDKRHARDEAVPIPRGAVGARIFSDFSKSSALPGVSFASATEREDMPNWLRSVSAPEVEPSAAPLEHSIFSRPQTNDVSFASQLGSSEPAPSESEATCSACLAADVKIRKLSEENAALRGVLSGKDERLHEKNVQLQELQEKIAALECQARVKALARRRGHTGVGGTTVPKVSKGERSWHKLSETATGVEGLSDSSSLSGNEDGRPIAEAAALRRTPNGSSSGSISGLLAQMLPDGDTNLDQDAPTIALHLGGGATQSNAVLLEDDDDASELGVTNQLGPLFHQAHHCGNNAFVSMDSLDHNIAFIGNNAFVSMDIHSDPLLETRAQCEDNSAAICSILEDEDDDTDLGVTNRLGSALAVGQPVAVDALMPATCGAEAAGPRLIDATPTTRGVAGGTLSMRKDLSDSSSMANTRWSRRYRSKSETPRTSRSEEDFKPRSARREEDAQAQAREASSPTTFADVPTQVFRAPAGSHVSLLSALSSNREPTLQLFSGRSPFSESPMS